MELRLRRSRYIVIDGAFSSESSITSDGLLDNDCAFTNMASALAPVHHHLPKEGRPYWLAGRDERGNIFWVTTGHTEPGKTLTISCRYTYARGHDELQMDGKCEQIVHLDLGMEAYLASWIKAKGDSTKALEIVEFGKWPAVAKTEALRDGIVALQHNDQSSSVFARYSSIFQLTANEQNIHPGTVSTMLALDHITRRMDEHAQRRSEEQRQAKLAMVRQAFASLKDDVCGRGVADELVDKEKRKDATLTHTQAKLKEWFFEQVQEDTPAGDAADEFCEQALNVVLQCLRERLSELCGYGIDATLDSIAGGVRNFRQQGANDLDEHADQLRHA